MPLFVLVDELTDADPHTLSASWKRIEHLFATDNVVFCRRDGHISAPACGTRRLWWRLYGRRYLKRFFDGTYVFEAPNLRRLSI